MGGVGICSSNAATRTAKTVIFQPKVFGSSCQLLLDLPVNHVKPKTLVLRHSVELYAALFDLIACES